MEITEALYSDSKVTVQLIREKIKQNGTQFEFICAWKQYHQCPPPPPPSETATGNILS